MANETPMPMVKIQFLDGNGDPYAAAKLFTYDSGTTNKADTYVSPGGAANTNPVVLDADGRASVFLSAQAYKFVLAPSTDSDPPVAAYWTMDAVSSVPYYGVTTGIVRTSVTPSWTVSDNTLALVLPPTFVPGYSQYLNNGTGTGNVSIGANTLSSNGDALICEWEVDYASADLDALATICGTAVQLGTGAVVSTGTRARYVVTRISNTNVNVSATVLQNTAASNVAIGMSTTNIGSLDLAATAYNINIAGMASGTYVVYGARIYYVKAVASGVFA